MSELSDSIAEAIKRRVVSTTLITYLVFWCVFHWQGLYVTLFVSQEAIQQKFGMLKNEYVNTYFFGWLGWQTILNYFGPLMLTALFIWPVPKFILIHAYRQEQRHKIDRRRVKLEEEAKLQVNKQKLEAETQKTLQAEINTAKIEKEAASNDPTILWKNDYERFQKSGLINILPDIATAVYEAEGRTIQFFNKDAGEWVGKTLSKDVLAIADTNDLITMTSGRIALTDKGKYFMSQSYLDKLP